MEFVAENFSYNSSGKFNSKWIIFAEYLYFFKFMNLRILKIIYPNILY